MGVWRNICDVFLYERSFALPCLAGVYLSDITLARQCYDHRGCHDTSNSDAFDGPMLPCTRTGDF